MTNSEEIYEFNKIDAYNKLKEAINYITGKDREQDFKKFMILCKTSALQGNSHAQYILGIFFEDGILGLERYFEIKINADEKYYEMTNSKTALKWYKKSARGNYKEAQYAVANMYFKGIDVERDYEKALYYFKSSKTEYACFYVGYIYEKGIGVMQDYEKAYQYYNLAAEKNCIKAMNKLGDWYKKGIFLSRNINLAIKWYEKAANKNDIDGVENLIQIYEKGIGNKKNDIKAIYYVFKLIDLDVLKGKERLIYYCYKGIGIEENKERGNELINEIEEIDKGTANFIKANLGENNLINMSKDEIINLYKDGIDLGNLNCYGNLAVFLYENDLYDSDKYKELFNIAMQGEHLGVKKCEYIYLKKKLKEFEISSIVTVEELIIIKKLTKLLNNGVYKVIDELIKWYSKRRPEEKTEYYKLMEDKIYYNLII